MHLVGKMYCVIWISETLRELSKGVTGYLLCCKQKMIAQLRTDIHLSPLTYFLYTNNYLFYTWKHQQKKHSHHIIVWIVANFDILGPSLGELKLEKLFIDPLSSMLFHWNLLVSYYKLNILQLVYYCTILKLDA